MQVCKLLIGVLLVFAAIGLFLLPVGCVKEYSFEKKPVDTLTIVNPSRPVASCAKCTSNTIADSTWQFNFEGATYCGQVEKAIILLERTAFTFFGTSACSSDSGFVATVYLDEPLVVDKTNVKARLACYYYDNVNASFMFMSPPGQRLQMNITNYNGQTGVASGTFSGFVELNNGSRREIKNGQFRIRFQ